MAIPFEVENARSPCALRYHRERWFSAQVRSGERTPMVATHLPDDQATDPRQRVVDAADALFYARGIRAVGMDDVRTASGVSLKRLYSLFPGKDSLVLAVLQKRHAMWTNGLTAAVDATNDAREKVLAIY